MDVESIILIVRSSSDDHSEQLFVPFEESTHN